MLQAVNPVQQSVRALKVVASGGRIEFTHIFADFVPACDLCQQVDMAWAGRCELYRRGSEHCWVARRYSARMFKYLRALPWMKSPDVAVCWEYVKVNLRIWMIDRALKGSPMDRQLFGLRAKATGQLLAIARALGLTPASRRRLKGAAALEGMGMPTIEEMLSGKTEPGEAGREVAVVPTVYEKDEGLAGDGVMSYAEAISRAGD